VKEKQEVALERDGQNLQLLIDAIVDYAIYMIGTDGRVLSWNTGAARMKGYTREEIIGKPFLQLLYA
jgi:PAS domain S-box-containing protein